MICDGKPFDFLSRLGDNSGCVDFEKSVAIAKTAEYSICVPNRSLNDIGLRQLIFRARDHNSDGVADWMFAFGTDLFGNGLRGVLIFNTT